LVDENTNPEGEADVKPLMALMNWATHDATMAGTNGCAGANRNKSLKPAVVQIIP
jgi:hypothetical protein